ncbi:histidine phosphatase family protein [Leptotrichia alba]
MTEILFIRHGETNCNKKSLYYGYLNPGLNETGIQQLKNTKKSSKI